MGPGGSPVFTDRLAALYAIAFTVKMASKRAARDYGVSKLEAQWWVRPGVIFMEEPPANWHWRLLIRTPDFIGKAEVTRAGKELSGRGKSSLVQEVELIRLAEGRAVQMLHVGPYTDEQESLARMGELAEANGFRFHGEHHEIYLSDPRRVAPARLRTILRQPVR
jgi:hypothetical protein